MKRTSKLIAFLFVILFCPFVVGAIAAPQSNVNYRGDVSSTNFQVGPKPVSASDSQALTLSNDMFGLSGPFSLHAVYSKLFGITFEGTYTQVLGLKDAALVELDLGGKQRRIAGTWGHALSSNQLFKVTAENLSQDLDFDFVTGKVNKWIYQNAIGGSYAYLLKDNLINDININAYYSKALSKSLPYIDYTSGANNYRDFRRIAGGEDKSASLGVNLLPISTTLIGIKANYDNVSYDMKNDLGAKRDANGLGATISLDQLINEHIKFNLLASHRKPYQDYKAELDWLLTSVPGSSLELGLLGERIIGNVGTSNDTQGGINLKYTWGGNPTDKPIHYEVPKADTGLSGLKDWVSNPAVRMSQVLALKDEKVELIGNTTIPSPKTAVTNGNAIEIHPGEAKQIDVTQYFASKINAANAKDASNVQYEAESLPNIPGLSYQDGKLVISKNSFTQKDVGKEIEIDFVPTNINSIPSLSMVSLILKIKDPRFYPYPNEKYRDTGSEPIKLILQAGKTYDETSFVKEDQTFENLIIINPAPDIADMVWSDAFTGFDDLKIVPHVEAKKIPGKESRPYSHYYVLTYSVPKGIPESAVGHHIATIAPTNDAGRCSPVLKIDITVIYDKIPTVNITTPEVDAVEDEPIIESVAEADAGGGEVFANDHVGPGEAFDIHAKDQSGNSHDLSYFGLHAEVKGEGGKTADFAKATIAIVGDKMAKSEDTPYDFEIIATNKDGKSSAAGSIFTLKMTKIAAPTVNITTSELDAVEDAPVIGYVAEAEAGEGEVFANDSVGPKEAFDIHAIDQNGNSHDLSYFGLHAEVKGEGGKTTDFAKATIAIAGDKPTNSQDTPQKFEIIATNKYGKSSAAGSIFTLKMTKIAAPTVQVDKQKAALEAQEQSDVEVDGMAIAKAGEGQTFKDETVGEGKTFNVYGIDSNGDLQPLDYFGLHAEAKDQAGKGTHFTEANINILGTAKNPNDNPQGFEIVAVNESWRESKKGVDSEFSVHIIKKSASPTVQVDKQKAALEAREQSKVTINGMAIAKAGEGQTFKDETVGEGKTFNVYGIDSNGGVHPLDYFGLHAEAKDQAGKGTHFTEANINILGTAKNPNDNPQGFEIVAVNESGQESKTGSDSEFSVRIKTIFWRSQCPTPDEIIASLPKEGGIAKVTKIPVSPPASNKITEFVFESTDSIKKTDKLKLAEAVYYSHQGARPQQIDCSYSPNGSKNWITLTTEVNSDDDISASFAFDSHNDDPTICKIDSKQCSFKFKQSSK